MAVLLGSTNTENVLKFYVYGGFLPLGVSVYSVCTAHGGQRRAAYFLELEIPLLDAVWVLSVELGPLEEQPVSLTIEPLLSPYS